MSTVATPDTVVAARPAVAQTRPGWMFSPTVDLLVVANLAWPLIAWSTYAVTDPATTKAFGFLLAYFLLTPHRWITLLLVFGDRDKFAQRPKAFLGVAAAVAIGGWLTQWSMGTLTLLMALDYLWNAWHFTAQHSGVYGIYGRLSETKRSALIDKVVLRTFILFTLVRLIGSFLPVEERGGEWLTWMTPVASTLAWCDYFVLAMPAVLLVGDLFGFRARRAGRVTYLLSVYSLYGLLLIAVRLDHTALKLGCATAATFFHSAEYMGVVSWAVQKNRGLQKQRLFAHLVPRWTMWLIAFMAFFAVSAYLLKDRFFYAWVWANLVVSLLHYAYDGMIWKRPRPAKSTA
jgi:hypothetical protein